MSSGRKIHHSIPNTSHDFECEQPLLSISVCSLSWRGSAQNVRSATGKKKFLIYWVQSLGTETKMTAAKLSQPLCSAPGLGFPENLGFLLKGVKQLRWGISNTHPAAQSSSPDKEHHIFRGRSPLKTPALFFLRLLGFILSQLYFICRIKLLA